jgi:ribosomal protein S27E
MNKHCRILCEECAHETHVFSEEIAEIEFCPCCGRRAEPEDLSEVDDI